MKKKRVLLSLLLASFFTLHCATMEVRKPFKKRYGGGSTDYGRSVMQTTDGGYILLGEARSFAAAKNDMSLIKTDPDGNELWEKRYGGSGHEYGRSVSQTTDGGYALLGYMYSFETDSWDMLCIKTDPDGNVLWNKRFGGNKTDMGYSLQQTADGGYILLGKTESFGSGGSDMYVIKLDISGEEEWHNTIGGKGHENGRSVMQTTDGGYILLGVAGSSTRGDWDMYLVKLDPEGNEEWGKSLGTTADEYARSVMQTSDGGYILFGYTWSPNGAGWDMYVIKTDPEGNMKWSNTFGGAKDDFGESVAQTADGGYMLVGRTASFGAGGNDVFAVKIDSKGKLIWNKTFGGAGNDFGVSVRQTRDGGYIILGFTSYSVTREYDMYLIKTNSDGSLH